MFDFGWDEMALIGVISLIVIGPKDLPKVMREAGRWMRRARQMAAEFQSGLEEMTRETEVHTLKQDVESALNTQAIKSEIEQAVKLDAPSEPFDVEAHNAAILKAEAEASQTAVSPEPEPAAPPAAAAEPAADPTHHIPPSP